MCVMCMRSKLMHLSQYTHWCTSYLCIKFKWMTPFCWKVPIYSFKLSQWVMFYNQFAFIPVWRYLRVIVWFLQFYFTRKFQTNSVNTVSLTVFKNIAREFLGLLYSSNWPLSSVHSVYIYSFHMHWIGLERKFKQNSMPFYW